MNEMYKLKNSWVEQAKVNKSKYEEIRFPDNSIALDLICQYDLLLLVLLFQ